MHTEEQAKTKWCPETRALQYQGSGSVNRRTDSPCIASGCMHWRWLNDVDDNLECGAYQKEQEARLSPPSGPGWSLQKDSDGWRWHRQATGYCGLSGSPR